MTSKHENQTIAIILLICLALIYIAIPLMNTKYIASLGIFGCAIYLLLK